MVLKNETHKILWDFEIQTDHQISVRRSDLVIANKKENLLNSGLYRSVWPQNKTEEREKRDKYLDLAKGLKKTVEHESDGNTDCN